VSKTGGGPGTNQYQVRGQAKRRPKEVCGYPADQVIKRGDCVWLRVGFDDPWCLKHRQLAPELRQLTGLPPCAARLGRNLQKRLARFLPAFALGPWVSQMPDAKVRCQLVKRTPKDQLDWATRDEDWRVRQAAAKRIPIDQLGWAIKDESLEVREVAAGRVPIDQLGWAIEDEGWPVRRAAARRMPEDELEWATRDPIWEVRRVAAERMPEDELEWAIRDEDWRVREAAAKRRPPAF